MPVMLDFEIMKIMMEIYKENGAFLETVSFYEHA